MRDGLALIATVDPAAGWPRPGSAVNSAPAGYSRLRDDLLWVAANGPRRLVLDLGGSDGFTEQLITVNAAARRKLPVGCLLEVCSARPAVRSLLLELAGWTGVRV